MRPRFGSAAQGIDSPARRVMRKPTGQWSRLGSVSFVVAFNLVVWAIVALAVVAIS